jgi:hypothetical protein
MDYSPRPYLAGPYLATRPTEVHDGWMMIDPAPLIADFTEAATIISVE